jgi:hypothetical protein
VKLEIISNERATYLWKEISRKRWRKNEPFDDEMIPEQPVLFQQAIDLIVEHGLKSKNQILDDLGYPVEMVREFCCLPDNFSFEGKLVNVLRQPSIKKSSNQQ